MRYMRYAYSYTYTRILYLSTHTIYYTKKIKKQINRINSWADLVLSWFVQIEVLVVQFYEIFLAKVFAQHSQSQISVGQCKNILAIYI